MIVRHLLDFYLAKRTQSSNLTPCTNPIDAVTNQHHTLNDLAPKPSPVFSNTPAPKNRITQPSEAITPQPKPYELNDLEVNLYESPIPKQLLIYHYSSRSDEDLATENILPQTSKSIPPDLLEQGAKLSADLDWIIFVTKAMQVHFYFYGRFT